MTEILENREKVIEIDVERLRPFRNHPFKIQQDHEMEKLTESIRNFGVLTPLVVRPLPEGVYEIISGHRRYTAAKEVGYTKVPVIIRVLKDQEAVIAMVDSNLSREHILPSEKAYAYRMKYDALKYTGGPKRLRGQIDFRYAGKRTLNIVGEILGESPKQVQRWIKLTNLIPELMDTLDAGRIGFCPASDLSYLKPEEQQIVYDAMKSAESSPAIAQSQRLRELSRSGELTEETAQEVMSEIKKGEIRRVMFRNEQLYQYFPRSYTPAQMKEEILMLLSSRAAENTNTTRRAWISCRGTSRSHPWRSRC